MKPTQLLLLLLFTLCFTATAQNKNATVQLAWKLTPTDTLRYKTVMNARVTQADTTNMFSKMAKELNEVNKNIDYTTELHINPKNTNLINIVMYSGNGKTDKAQQGENFGALLSKMKEEDNAKKQEKKNKAGKKDKKDKDNRAITTETAKTADDTLMLSKLFKGINKAFNNNVALRGCITKNGTIAANYYKTSQTNLIALLFELPGKPVTVGEVWHPHVQLIQMDQNFVADSVAEVNKAFIEKIETINGNSIAVIKYEASSYILGDFDNPMQGILEEKEDRKISMTIKHNGTARFNITTGRLESYDGLMENESDVQLFGGKSETVFKLTPN